MAQYDYYECDATLEANAEFVDKAEDVSVNGYNIDIEKVRSGAQSMIAYVIDISGSIAYCNYEEAMIKALEMCRDTIKKSKGSIQVSLTKFGSKIDVQPFKYVDDIDFTYKANGGSTRMYDAINVAAKFLSEQYMIMNTVYSVNGCMVILTDGKDNQSGAKSKELAESVIKLLKDEAGFSIVFGLLGERSEFPEITSFCDKCDIPAVTLDDPHKIRRLLRLLTESYSSLNNGQAKKMDQKTLQMAIDEGVEEDE